MKILKNIFIGAIIIAILFFAGFFTGKYLKKCPEPQQVEVHDTIPGDSILYLVKMKIPVPVEKIVKDTEWRYRPVDTFAILQQYFNIIYTKDSIRGPDIKGVLEESISHNTIIDRKLFLQNTRSTAINTTVLNEFYWAIYGGASAYLGERSGFGPSLLYVDKKRAIGAGYDILNKRVQISYSFQLIHR